MEKTQLRASNNELSQVPDEVFLDKARKLRPFYFIVVVWGERYTDFLLNFCIPALLSPNNIPALRNRGNKFLIATTDEDWERMQPRPIFKLLKEYVEPVFIRIPPCPEGVSQCVHMGIGHKLATHMAFEDRAYAAVLTPDMMVSEGTIAAAQRHAVNGVQVVLVAALRFGEEPLFEHLEKLGVASINSRFGDEGRPLVATGRQFVWAGLRSFHSETLRYEWEKPCFASFPSAVWWRVDEDGIIVHSLSWAPLLVDYDAVEHHDSSAMDNWTIDGDYVYRNFGVEGKIHVVQDSDEIMLISWAPLSDREQSLEPTQREYTYRFIGEWIKGGVFNTALSNPIFDPLKKRIFPMPVYWHARDIDAKKWNSVERKAISVIRKYGIGFSVNIKGAHQLTRMHELGAQGLVGFRRLIFLLDKVRVVIIRMPLLLFHLLFRYSSQVIRMPLVLFRYSSKVAGFLFYYWSNRRHVMGLAKQAFNGDAEARKRVKRSFRYFGKQIMGSRNVYD